jgi:hypothetical protein
MPQHLGRQRPASRCNRVQEWLRQRGSECYRLWLLRNHSGSERNGDLSTLVQNGPMARSCLTSASFLSFVFGVQHLRPFQNFVLDFRFQVHEIPIIAAVVSVFGKSPRKVGVIFHMPPRSMSVKAIFRQLTATMAQPGHLEYQRASRHAPPQQVGEGTGLSRFQESHGTGQMSLPGSTHRRHDECNRDVSTVVSYQRPRLISHGCGMAKVISSRPSMAMFFRKLIISPCFACWS